MMTIGLIVAVVLIVRVADAWRYSSSMNRLSDDHTLGG